MRKSFSRRDMTAGTPDDDDHESRKSCAHHAQPVERGPTMTGSLSSVHPWTHGAPSACAESSPAGRSSQRLLKEGAIPVSAVLEPAVDGGKFMRYTLPDTNVVKKVAHE